MLRVVTTFLLFSLCSSVLSAEAPDHTAHQELRALLNGIEEAINSGRYSEMSPYFHQHMRVTTINQEVLSSPDEIGSYFNRWFGSDGYLSKLQIELTADDLTEFYADGGVGVVRGSGKEDYTLADGRGFNMATRWTATVIRDEDERWRILTLHIGTNFLDNPILSRAEGALMMVAITGFIIGIAIFLIVGFILKRMRRSRSGLAS